MKTSIPPHSDCGVFKAELPSALTLRTSTVMKQCGTTAEAILLQIDTSLSTEHFEIQSVELIDS